MVCRSRQDASLDIVLRICDAHVGNKGGELLDKMPTCLALSLSSSPEFKEKD